MLIEDLFLEFHVFSVSVIQLWSDQILLEKFQMRLLEDFNLSFEPFSDSQIYGQKRDFVGFFLSWSNRRLTFRI